MSDNVISNLRHVGLFVNDLEMMRNFYVDCFGFSEKSHAHEGGTYLETFLGVEKVSLENYKLNDSNGMILELLKTDDRYDDRHSDKVCNVGCLHIAFTVSDAEKLREKLVEKGCKPISECLVSPDKKAKVFFCKDPEENYLEIVQEL